MEIAASTFSSCVNNVPTPVTLVEPVPTVTVPVRGRDRCPRTSRSACGDIVPMPVLPTGSTNNQGPRGSSIPACGRLDAGMQKGDDWSTMPTAQPCLVWSTWAGASTATRREPVR